MSQKAAAGPDEIAGRYQVVQKLGAGAFGTVYKARDRILGRMVAIKTIRLEGLAAAGASLDELMNRFKREAMVSAQLKHPNIVTVYDIGESEGMSYLAMEFIDGVGLDRIIAAAGRLPVERAAVLGAQVADALDFAHRSNFVHRDIKPANIMVEAGDRVKVTDFGIAHVTNSLENLTATGSLLGTPSYMSPEQARGAALDGRSDLFAVGCILYEMVTGKKAFRGDSITGLIFKIITEDPPPMRELDPSVPDEVVRIVARALAKPPETRYQSGRELADDLLGLTRAGSTPTLRQSEVATAPGLAPPGASPTLQVTPTLAADAPTGVSAGATARATAPAPPTTLMPPGDPTKVAAAPALPRPAAPRAPALPRPAAPTPARSRSGVALGVLAAGLVALLAAGVGAFLVLRPKGDRDVAAGGATPPELGSPGTAPSAVPATVTTGEVQPAPTAEASAPPASQGTEAGSAAGAPARAAAATEPPPPPTGRAGTSAGPVGGRATAPPLTTPPAATESGPDIGFLDREPPEMDGREAGERLSDTYRNERGTRFGTNRRFPARPRFPRDATRAERRGVFVLLNVMHYQALHRQRTGRYGSFQDVLPKRVPSPNSFEYVGYRFEQTVEPDGFRVLAIPLAMGLRGFVADDTGFVRFADE